MPKELLQLISRILDQSGCSAEEKEELKKELSSHILEAIKELELQGKSESAIIQSIKQEFGDPDELGQQFFLVHKRFEKIPWIGPLLYYVPARMGIRLLLTHLILYMSSLAFLMFVLPLLLDSQSESTAQLIEKIFFGTFILLSLAQGVMVSKKIIRLSSFGETVITSFIPVACLIFLFLLFTGSIEGRDFASLFRLLAWPLGSQLAAILVGWAVSATIQTKFQTHGHIYSA